MRAMMNKLYAVNRYDAGANVGGQIGENLSRQDTGSATQNSVVQASSEGEEDRSESDIRPASVQRINPLDDLKNNRKRSNQNSITVRQLAFLLSVYRQDVIFQRQVEYYREIFRTIKHQDDLECVQDVRLQDTLVTC